jgi:hypothetical protein
VIGKGDVRHPFLFQPLIQLPRIGIAIWKFEATENPFCGSIAEFRVDMEIDFGGHLVSAIELKPNSCAGKGDRFFCDDFVRSGTDLSLYLQNPQMLYLAQRFSA